jgi:glycosyltransferase involved in cell wall biosynthesis
MSNHDLIERNETNKNAMGGTELLQERLYDGSVRRDLLEQFQIIFSRVRELDENRYRIFYAHDLAGDPEADEALGDGKWNRFHKIVFVSNWQMQSYINRYSIPWSHCEVIENSIIPLDRHPNADDDDEIRICYTSTPHRGLHILYAAFDALSKKHSNIKLDVFSSFELYGWKERDDQYRELFSLLDAHPHIINHGTKPNEDIREYLECYGDIFAYPSIWPETSCLCLIEAMSAGLLCIHSNYGALPETSSEFTYMYQFHEDENAHATRLYHLLDHSIEHLNAEATRAQIRFAQLYANARFDWRSKSLRWNGLLESIVMQNPLKKIPGKMFSYNVG